MKNKKKYLLIAIVISTIAIVMFNIIKLEFTHDLRTIQTYESNWDLTLPHKMKVLYNLDDYDGNFFAERNEIIIFLITNIDNNFIKDFYDYKHLYMENEIDKYYIKLNGNNKFKPIWNNYLWKKITKENGSDITYLIFFKNTNQLFTVASYT